MILEKVIPFLPKKQEVKNVHPMNLTNPDDVRTRRNKFAALCNSSNNLKKAA